MRVKKRGAAAGGRRLPLCDLQNNYFVDDFTIYVYSLYLFCIFLRTFTFFEYFLLQFTELYVCFIFIFLLQFYRDR